MFRVHVLIIRRSKLHYTASGIITPIGGRLVHEKRPHSYFPFAVVARGPVEIRRNMIPIPLSVRAGVNLGVALRFRT